MLKPVLALCLVGCFSFSNAQEIDNSGNLINNQNWSGATYGVDPGGCCASISGSGALYDTSTDTIMFSYATDTLTQTIGLQQALGGTGIQVHGYNWSFDYRLVPKTDGTLTNDYLFVDIWMTAANGSTVEAISYNLSNATMTGIMDTFMSVSGTRTFDAPYTDPQSISMRIAGYDGGFWGGYYGPEVRNVSLSVNYSFDPCAADPLYSSSCPGYLEAYMAYLFQMLGWSTTPEPETEVAAIDYSLTPSTSSSTSAPEETTTGEVKVDAGGIEVSTTGELQVPDGIPEEAREKKPVDMNLISRIVREATDDSAALSVVNRSIEQSMAEDANPDSSMTSETLAAIARQQDASVEQSIAENQEAAQSGIMFQPELGVVESHLAGGDMGISEATGESEQVSSTATPAQLADQDRIEIKQPDTDRAETAVQRDVADNDAAGGVGIEDIATEPQDFGMYLAKQLADVQFYQTEEIYRGLEPVDNRRSLRMLSGANDRLHQAMVDEQYRRR
jgi:hypothetical protein